MHACPVKNCGEEVSDEMLMCRSHWYQVPKGLRDAVWRTWRRGAGRGTKPHMAAIRAAIKAVNEKVDQ